MKGLVFFSDLVIFLVLIFCPFFSRVLPCVFALSLLCFKDLRFDLCFILECSLELFLLSFFSVSFIVLISVSDLIVTFYLSP